MKKKILNAFFIFLPLIALLYQYFLIIASVFTYRE